MKLGIIALVLVFLCVVFVYTVACLYIHVHTLFYSYKNRKGS